MHASQQCCGIEIVNPARVIWHHFMAEDIKQAGSALETDSEIMELAGVQ